MHVQGTAAPESGPAAEPLRFGFTLDDVGRLTYAALRYDTVTRSLDAGDRYEAAWFGIVERLWTAGEPPTRGELIHTGRLALNDLANDYRRIHGFPDSDRVRGDGPGRRGELERERAMRPRFATYWIGAHTDPEPPFVTAVVDRIALRQVFAQLPRAQRTALLALALHRDYRGAAASLGRTEAHFSAMVDNARDTFLSLWHDGSQPPPRTRSHAGPYDLRSRVAAVLSAGELPGVLLPDARAVFTCLGVDAPHSADLLRHLAEARPQVYAGWDTADLGCALRHCGVPPASTRTIDGVKRRSYQLQGILDATENGAQDAPPDECDMILAAWLDQEQARPDALCAHAPRSAQSALPEPVPQAVPGVPGSAPAAVPAPAPAVPALAVPGSRRRKCARTCSPEVRPS